MTNFSFHFYVEIELDLTIALFGLNMVRTNSSSKHLSISCALSLFFVVIYTIILQKEKGFIVYFYETVLMDSVFSNYYNELKK